MKKILFLTPFFLFVLVAFGLADVSIKAEIDKTRITTDDVLTYKLVITATEKGVPQLQLPKFTGFAVVSQEQSQSLSFEKGGVKANIVYTFLLVPIDAGKFAIGPATIKTSKESYSTQQFDIEIVQGKAESRHLPEQKSPLPGKPLPESKEPQITL